MFDFVLMPSTLMFHKRLNRWTVTGNTNAFERSAAVHTAIDTPAELPPTKQGHRPGSECQTTDHSEYQSVDAYV